MEKHFQNDRTKTEVISTQPHNTAGTVTGIIGVERSCMKSRWPPTTHLYLSFKYAAIFIWVSSSLFRAPTKAGDDKERVGGGVSGGGRIEAGGEWFCSKHWGDAEKEPAFSDKEVITECFVIDQQEHWCQRQTNCRDKTNMAGKRLESLVGEHGTKLWKRCFFRNSEQ